MFFTAFVFEYFEIILTQNSRPNNVQKISFQSHKTQIKILAYHELPTHQSSPGASLSGLAKAIYDKTLACDYGLGVTY